MEADEAPLSWQRLARACRKHARDEADGDGAVACAAPAKRSRFTLSMGDSDSDADDADKKSESGDADDHGVLSAPVSDLTAVYDVRVCVDVSLYRAILARGWVFSQLDFPEFAKLVESLVTRLGFDSFLRLPATNVLSRALVKISDRPGLVQSVSWYLSIENKERLVDAVARELRRLPAPMSLPPAVLAIFNGSGVHTSLLRENAAGMVASICNLSGLSALHVSGLKEHTADAHRNRVFAYGVLAVSRLARQLGANLSMEAGWQALFADFVGQRESFLPVAQLADLQQGIDEPLRTRASNELDAMCKMLQPVFEITASAMRALLSGQSAEQLFASDPCALELWQAAAKIVAVLIPNVAVLTPSAASRVENMVLCNVVERRASDVEFALFISGQIATLRRVAAFRAANPDAQWYTVPSASALAMTHVLSQCGFDTKSDSKSLCAACKLFVSDYSYDDVGACTVQTLNILTTPFYLRLLSFYTCCLARQHISSAKQVVDALPGPAYIDLVDMLLDSGATTFDDTRFQHILRAFAWWLGYVLVDESQTALRVELAHTALKGEHMTLAYVVGMLFAVGSKGVRIAADVADFARFGKVCVLNAGLKGMQIVPDIAVHDYLQRICRSPSQHPVAGLLRTQISGRTKRDIGDSARWLLSQKAVGGFPAVAVSPQRQRARDAWFDLAQVFRLCDGLLNGMGMSTVAVRSTVHVDDIVKMAEVFHTTTIAGSFGWKQRIWMPRSDFSDPVLSDDFRPFFARLRRMWRA